MITEELIARCKNGSKDAFEELVHAVTPQLYALTLSIMGNEHDARDAAQETFIKIYKSIGKFRAESSVTTWIHRIAVNTCMDELRRRGRYKSVSVDEDDSVLQIEDPSPTPEEIVVTAERRQEVRNAIAVLPSDYKAVVTLRDIRGLSYEEIAEILACPLGTVKSRIARARKLLLARLAKNRELFHVMEGLKSKGDETDEL